MPELFEVAIWRGEVDAYNLVLPSGRDAEIRRVTPEALARILRAIAAFEAVQRELQVEEYDWIYNWGMSLLAAALHANDATEISKWFRQIEAYKRPE